MHECHKWRQSGGILGRLLGPKIGMPLIRNVLKQLAESVLVSLVLTAATDASIHKKCLDRVIRHY